MSNESTDNVFHGKINIIEELKKLGKDQVINIELSDGSNTANVKLKVELV